MAEMVGAELRLEPVRRLAERRRHDARIANDEIERLAVGDERVGASPDARERRQVELDQLKAAAVRSVGAHRRGRLARLCKIARGADHLSAMRYERARRLDAEAGRHARHQHTLAGQAYALEHLVGGGFRAEGFRHDRLLIG